MSELPSAWWDIFHNQRLTARSVIITAMEGGDTTLSLRHALAAVAPSDYPGAYSPHKLGRWLARYAGVPFTLSDGRVYRYAQRQERVGAVWQLVPDASVSDPPSLEEALPRAAYVDAI